MILHSLFALPECLQHSLLRHFVFSSLLLTGLTRIVLAFRTLFPYANLGHASRNLLSPAHSSPRPTPFRSSAQPNMPRQTSESAGPFHVRGPGVFSESHDVNDMQLRVVLADPNGPRAPLRFNLDDPDGWEPTDSPVIISPFLLVNFIAWTLLLVAQSSAERRGALNRVRHLWWNTGTKLGRSQPRAGFAGRLSHAPTSLCPRNSSQNVSPATSRRSSWVSWSESPREELANEEVSDDASGPCAPNKSKFHDRLSVSGLRAASEQAMATCFSGKKKHVMRNTCPPRSLCLTFSLVLSAYRVLRTSTGRDETGRRDSANPRPARGPNGKRNAS